MKKAVLLIVLLTFLSTSKATNYPTSVSVSGDNIRMTNGVINLGISMKWGGGINEFSRIENGTTGINVLNQFDAGRNIQQSFYGTDTVGTFNGSPWPFNPVQGGDKYNNQSGINDFDISLDGEVYVRTIPLDWSLYNVQTPTVMEQWVRLYGDVAHVRYRFTYNGTKTHNARHQEMPAPYFIRYLKNLYYYSGSSPWTGKPLTKITPISQSSPITNMYANNLTENWAAYTNDLTWGAGIYFPGTTQITYFGTTGTQGPTGSATSYFAALRTLGLQPGFQVEYDVYLNIANVVDIRDRFNQIRRYGVEIVDTFNF